MGSPYETHVGATGNYLKGDSIEGALRQPQKP